MTIAHKKTSVLHYTVHHNLIGTCYMRKPLLLLVLAFHAAIPLTSYADYLVVVPTTKAQRAADLALNLSGGALPAAIKGELYSESLNKYLRVTGDPKFKASDVTWTLSSGSLPSGMTLTDATITGTPTTKGNAAFEVLASYKDKSGQQSYTILVNGRKLQVKAISIGGSHSCAITTVGGVKCWGLNDEGQLGNNSLISSRVPVDVEGLTAGVSSVTAGASYTCAVTTAGAVKCWGRNSFGQLGNNSTVSSSVPVATIGLSSGVALVVAGPLHACATTQLGAAKCWGYNTSGQLGNNSLENSKVPVDVVGLSSGVTSVALGMNHTCAATSSGTAKCWGENLSGQLGNEGYANSAVPLNVFSLSDANFLTAGNYHTCAITSGEGLMCWGYNSSGQLGNNTTEISRVPVDVVGLTNNVASAEAGSNHTCATTYSGALKCWGSNYSGQLGIESTESSTVPVDVIDLSVGVGSVSAGANHTCAVTSSDAGEPKAVKCWGDNSYGQLSYATNTYRYQPGEDIEY